VKRPFIIGRNVFIGKLYLDLKGTILAKSHKTGAEGTITFHPSSTFSDSSIQGTIKDGSGRQKFEISGTWKSDIFLRDLATGLLEKVWSPP